MSNDLEIALRSADDATTYLMDDEHEVEFEENGCNEPSHAQVSSCPALTSVFDNSVANPVTVDSLNAKTTEPASRGHSTLSDANFVENYFKFSRLHFIGTWRNRYRKRFPNSHDCSKDKNSSHNGSVSQRSTIIHVDMDCFFVAVVIRNRPDLKDKPVAICHSDSSRGTAEISSANYPARDHGVKAGMFVRDAKALCPELVIFPYNFDAYEEVADQFYDILHKHCNKVQAVSCDEAFLDVSDSAVEDPSFLASAIRKEILDTTGCTASVGIAGNMLMARVATRIAKPDGCCFIPLERVDRYLHDLPVKALPGIGHVLDEKLRTMQIRTCGQLRMISKESLQKDFGIKTGDMLWNFSRGIDSRMVGVIQETKSVGAEVNWGVRFNDLNDAKDFLLKLCKEVSLRLEGCGVQGRNITLKIKKRRSSAGEPVKFMGCGDCENLSRSTTLPMATDDVHVLQRIANKLFGYFQIDAKDIRGMGLQASKLEAADTNRRGHEKCSIRSWLVSSGRKGFTNTDSCKLRDRVNSRTGLDSVSMVQSEGSGEVAVSREATLPGLDELDIGVIESLPPEVFREINDLYSGELINLLSKNKQNNKDFGMTSMVPQNIADVMDEERSAFETLDKIPCDEEDEYVNGKAHLKSASIGEASSSASGLLPTTDSLMPSSLSQVDPFVLQHLPEELRVDILESLRAHRNPHLMSNDVSVKYDVAQTASEDFMMKNELWIGNPPKWVDNFARSSCSLLNIFAELHNSSCPGSQFSSLLQSLVSGLSLLPSDGQDDAFSSLCELIKQYVDVKIETDIEEIYTCLRLLRRLSLRSKLFLRIYDNVLPRFQAAVCEHYGGNLNICLMDE
ncbi:OLC1v1000122C2 [Oldenlandia corymbosa var. corymbosa]|nr:OLC1v1000122C2 [Oldenlandia corymbosa var. corymbosa]